MTQFRFLHITDCHLSENHTADLATVKLKVPGVTQPSREAVLRDTLASLQQQLASAGQTLDAVLVSGDGTFKGDETGQKALRRMLLELLGPVGVSRANLVVTPGNHDIVARSAPSTPERYRLFKEAWLEPEPVVVPFLDGIHDVGTLNARDHVLCHPQRHWAIFPINSSNWSQSSLAGGGDANFQLVQDHLASQGNPSLVEAFNALCSYDIARISDDQSRALTELVRQTGDVKVRIAMLHHHLLPVDSREEFKTFCDITNLGHLRQLLKELGFHVVVHGHKHSRAAFYDYVSPEGNNDDRPHRILTISGGTLDGQPAENAAQLVAITDASHAPSCEVKPVSVSKAGRTATISSPTTYRLWEEDQAGLGPILIAGTSIDDVYRRVVQTVANAPERPIICTVDFPQGVVDHFPANYPQGRSDDERRAWFEETVRWWQLPASRIEMRIPYIHGSRLKRYGGGYNQIERVVQLLREGSPTSKAIAVVIDPARDFAKDKAFASFCFVQFCLRRDRRLDCIGYYRTQEFHSWWPVNVAELRHLQTEIADELSLTYGKITTITPYPRLTENIRTPTKVAVPLIDQWVDNHPARIAQIAWALSRSREDATPESLACWTRCLDDLEQGIQSFHADGIPVAIEGLALLKDWLAAIGAPMEIILRIEQLHDANDSHRKNDSMDSFNRWQRQVKPILAELRLHPKSGANMPTEQGQ